MASDFGQNVIYPFEMVVAGTPISLQSSSESKSEWKSKVKAAGLQRVRQTDDLGFLYPCPVALTIYYFPFAPMAGDIDNIVKPIMDDLVDVAYRNDRLVERVIVQKFEPQEVWAFDNPSGQLATALQAVLPLVYIRVDDDLGWRTVR